MDQLIVLLRSKRGISIDAISAKLLDDRPPKANLDEVRDNLQAVVDGPFEKHPELKQASIEAAKALPPLTKDKSSQVGELAAEAAAQATAGHAAVRKVSK